MDEENITLLYWKDGIRILDSKTDKITALCDKQINYPKQFQYLNDRKLLLITEKYNDKSKTSKTLIEIIEKDSCSHKEIDLVLGYISRVHAISDSNFYFSLKDGVYSFSINNNNFKEVLKLDNSASDITSSADGKNIYILVKNNLIYFSSDYGRNWEKILTPFNRIKKIEYFKDNILFAATDKGIARFVHSEWQICEKGIDEVEVNTISFDDKNNLYCGTEMSGVFRKKDSLSEWEKIYDYSNDSLFKVRDALQITVRDSIKKATSKNVTMLKSDYNKIIDIVNLPGNQMLISTVFGLRKSTDNGISWTIKPNPAKQRGPAKKVLLNSQNRIFALYNNNLFSTAIDSYNWEILKPPDDSIFVTDFTIDTNDNVFVSTSNRIDNSYKQECRTYLVKNLEQSWKRLNPIPGNTVINLYSGKYGQTYAVVRHHPYIFDSDSLSWRRIGDLLGYNINYVLRTKDKLYTNSYNETFISDGGIKSEKCFYEGIDIKINKIVEDNDGNIYSATDEGAFILRHKQEIPVSYDTTTPEQIIINPNPVSYDGEIIFYLKTSNKARLLLIDSLGKEYNFLNYNLTSPKGINKVKFNSSTLKPGKYKCRLTDNNKSFEKEFEVIRIEP
jgi:hypothetical protein